LPFFSGRLKGELDNSLRIDHEKASIRYKDFFRTTVIRRSAHIPNVVAVVHHRCSGHLICADGADRAPPDERHAAHAREELDVAPHRHPGRATSGSQHRS
jgi:hypothetical protein